MRRARVAGVWAGFAGTLLPALASACAVCGGGPERSRLAFLISTGFLSLLPLGMIAGGLLWLRRHARTALRGEFLDRDEVAIPAAVRARKETAPGAAEAPARLGNLGAPANV